MSKKKTQDELDLERMHTVEDPAGNVLESSPREPEGLSDEALHYIGQIKELQSKLEDAMIEVQRLEMSILGYSTVLEQEMSTVKGH
jgi:hypothetical protein